jgi:hypothetical protein
VRSGVVRRVHYLDRGASPRRTPLHARSRGPRSPAPLAWFTRIRSFTLRPSGYRRGR